MLRQIVEVGHAVPFWLMGRSGAVFVSSSRAMIGRSIARQLVRMGAGSDERIGMWRAGVH
ncbi:hypothetical protein [Mycobacterium antarcticum]|uniref:hypothetical protein n=1 Tax=Mycolicibacterium sp. TUM20985 TaxID=3023370 RepID=UPI002573E781|nr:hypothetical protein [Mycolicibacterium sp. TUM20985]